MTNEQVLTTKSRRTEKRQSERAVATAEKPRAVQCRWRRRRRRRRSTQVVGIVHTLDCSRDDERQNEKGILMSDRKRRIRIIVRTSKHIKYNNIIIIMSI